MKNNYLLLIAFILIFFSCDFSINVKNKNQSQIVEDYNDDIYPKISPKIFSNYTIINFDSCRKWDLPWTRFIIEYPDKYIVKSNPLKDNYLSLYYSEKGIMTEVIDISYSKHTYNQKDVDKIFIDFEMLFQKQDINYEYISEKIVEFNEKGCFILSLKINADDFKKKNFEGAYVLNYVVCMTPTVKLSSITILFTRKLIDKEYELTEEENKILESVRFIY